MNRSIIAEIQGQTRAFRWSSAAEVGSRYVGTIPPSDHAKRGDMLERIGSYWFSAAMQSKTRKQFFSRVRKALSQVKLARECFEALGTSGSAQLLRCRAMEAYLAYWISRDFKGRNRLLDESWRLANKALRRFKSSKNNAEYVEAFLRFSFPVALSIEYDGNLRSRAKKLRDAIQGARKTLSIVGLSGQKEELVRTQVKLSLLLDKLADDSSDTITQREYQRESVALLEESLRVARKTALQEISHPLSGFHQLRDPNQKMMLCKEALRIAKDRRDNFAIGRLMDQLSKWTYYAARSGKPGGDPAIAVRMHSEALHFAEEAARHYDIINLVSPIAGVLWVHSPYADHFLQLANYQNRLADRQLLLEKSLRSTRELLQMAQQSGSQRVMFYALHTTMKSEVLSAENTTLRRKQRGLLRKALRHGTMAYQIVDKIDSSKSWNRGVTIVGVANAQSKLAGLEEDSHRQTQLLLDTVQKLEDGLRIAIAFVKTLERPEHPVQSDTIGQWHRDYGDILLRLDSLAKEGKRHRKAANQYLAATEWFSRIPRYDKVAQCHWKSAETYDHLHAYTLASESFTLASRAYTNLGRRTPSLKEMSRDYASYLAGWSKIERARSNHSEFHHQVAARSFKHAARLHKSTKRWRFLAPYYLAWSKLESGEDLSRNDRHGDAIRTFRKAAKLFQDSRVLSKQRLATLDEPDERRMVSQLVEVPSETYCQARIILEDAVLAESAEDYQTSFEKFGLAAEKLREFSEESGAGQDRRETGFLSALCHAWKLSDKAELEGSIRPLERAQSFFVKARKMGPTESAKKLALGHEVFCKALIASRKFVDGLNLAHHDEASRLLDLAAGYYRDAGFKTASNRAIARKFLLDASVHLSNAQKERSPEKRAQSYKLASALLEESARTFQKARQPRKREQALGLLEKAKLESQIAFRLTEILAAASGSPSNVAFHSPAQGDERAVGLERFERSDIEVKVNRIMHGASLNGRIELEMEIVNIGERPIMLMRVEAAPDSSRFFASEATGREEERVEFPRQVGPAATHSVRLTVRPKFEGLVRLEPRVAFVDDKGLEREKLLEPVILATSRILEFLAESFVTDYADRRLAEANCGWRTMMEIVNSLKIPRSRVYGDPRYGRAFGRHLDPLVRSSVVEYRIFQGERGRGGDITRVRISVGNENVKKYIEQMTSDHAKPGRLEREVGYSSENKAIRPQMVVV